MADPQQYRPARRKTDVAATLVVEDVLLRVRVLDISRDGAKLALPGWVAPGTAVRLCLGSNSTPALVHWVSDGRAGLRFFDRLDGETLTAIERADDPLNDFR